VVWWGVVELSTAIQLGLVKYGFKLAIAAIDTPFIYWAISWNRPAQEQPKQSQN
jgi:queuosine precursor transporter